MGSLTEWDKILKGVRAYEEMEATILKTGNPTTTELNKVKPRLLQLLQQIEGDCLAWQTKNPDTKNLSDQWHAEATKKRGKLQETDTRAKAERRQAVAMLLPRIRLEQKDIASGTWQQGLGLSDTKLQGQGVQDRGQKNVVQELHYVTESGPFSGYFKEEKGFAKEPEGHELRVGIHQADPNYGARSVAMYRLDQLLGANVTARAEFAVHDGKLGTVLQSASPGTKASDTKWAGSKEHQQQVPGSVASDDPVLQRALNKLQILDAICGQLDRHQGNWYVQQDRKTGQVTGVTGIDLDMAFGSEHKDPNKLHGENYLGMSELVDEQFGRTILGLKATDIEAVLKGLLSDAEVSATVERFLSVQSKIADMDKKGLLTKTWGKESYEKSVVQESTFKSGHKTYTSQMKGNAMDDAVIPAIKKAVKDALAGEDVPGFDSGVMDQFRDLPPITASSIKDNLRDLLTSTLPNKYVWSGDWPPHQASAIALGLITEVLKNSSLMARMEIAVQEHLDPQMSPYVAVQPILQPWLLARAEELKAKRPKVTA